MINKKQRKQTVLDDVQTEMEDYPHRIDKKKKLNIVNKLNKKIIKTKNKKGKL
jgi:hypothetical protein